MMMNALREPGWVQLIVLCPETQLPLANEYIDAWNLLLQKQVPVSV